MDTALTHPAPSPLWPLFASKPLPRLHVLSDLHLERGPYEIPAEVEYDILVAAGDIGPVEEAVPWLAKQGKPVVYVLGNHERWTEDILGAVAKAKELAKGTQVHVLEAESIVLQGVRFLGCTLWTDLRRFHREFVLTTARCLRDHEFITCESWLADPVRAKRLEALCKKHEMSMPVPREGGRLLHPGITYLENQAARKWLARQLAKDFAGPTVVVTHHAPSDESLVRNGISREKLAVKRWGWRDEEPARIAGYASEGLLEEVGGKRALLWVHGHTHSAMDYLLEGTRVVCNPRGRQHKPLTMEDIRGYSLFGISLTEADVKRSQEAAAADPYRGDGRDFDKTLVVDFEQFLERPLSLATEDTVETVQTLVHEIHSLLPHLGAGESVAERCVGESIESRLEKLQLEMDGVGKSLLSQLDRYFDTPALQTIRTPHVPRAWDVFDQRWPTEPDELADIRTRTTVVLQWLEALPQLPRRSLEAWRAAAATAIKATKDAGFELRLRRLPASALKRLDVRDLHLIAMNEAALREDPEYALEKLLDNVLNGGRVPRRWLTRVMEPEKHFRAVAPKHLATMAP